MHISGETAHWLQKALLVFGSNRVNKTDREQRCKTLWKLYKLVVMSNFPISFTHINNTKQMNSVWSLLIDMLLLHVTYFY